MRGAAVGRTGNVAPCAVATVIFRSLRRAVDGPMGVPRVGEVQAQLAPAKWIVGLAVDWNGSCSASSEPVQGEFDELTMRGPPLAEGPVKGNVSAQAGLV